MNFTFCDRKKNIQKVCFANLPLEQEGNVPQGCFGPFSKDGHEENNGSEKKVVEEIKSRVDRVKSEINKVEVNKFGL